MSNTELIRELVDCYPLAKLTDRNVTAYINAFKDTPTWRLRPAVEYLRDNGGSFFPTVSEIKRTIRTLDPQPPRISTPAGDFWQNMTALSHTLQGVPVDVDMPERVASEYDGLTPAGLERLADERSGYKS